MCERSGLGDSRSDWTNVCCLSFPKRLHCDAGDGREDAATQLLHNLVTEVTYTHNKRFNSATAAITLTPGKARQLVST